MVQPLSELRLVGRDGASNRTAAGSDAYSYDAWNRLTTGPAGSYSYSERGDVLSVVGADSATFGWDGLSRMATADAVSYTYDGLDRIAARNGVGFSYTGLWIDPTSDGVNTYARSPAGRVVAHDDGTVASLVGSDRHGDITWLADPVTGALSDSKVYDPFGEVAAVTGVSGISVGFQSDYTDVASGEVWMGARWYDPTGAQFRSRDGVFGELTTPVSLNRYTYGFANPLVFWDPDGRFSTNSVLIDGIGSLQAIKERAAKEKAARTQQRVLRKLRQIEGPEFEDPTARATTSSEENRRAQREVDSRGVRRCFGSLCPAETATEPEQGSGGDGELEAVSITLSGIEGLANAATVTIQLQPVDRGWIAHFPDGTTEFIRSTRKNRIELGSSTETFKFTDEVVEQLDRVGLRNVDPVALRKIADRLGLGFDVTVVAVDTFIAYDEGGVSAAVDTAAHGASEIVGSAAAVAALRPAVQQICGGIPHPVGKGVCSALGYALIVAAGTAAGGAVYEGLTEPSRCERVTVPPTCLVQEVPEA